MYYYNVFSDAKDLSLELFSRCNDSRMKKYFKQTQNVILLFNDIIKKKKEVRICKYKINKITLGFYMQCLNYQTHCYITETELSEKKWSKNLHFLCILHNIYELRRSNQLLPDNIIRAEKRKEIFIKNYEIKTGEKFNINKICWTYRYHIISKPDNLRKKIMNNENYIKNKIENLKKYE